jgi:hypothetical protein
VSCTINWIEFLTSRIVTIDGLDPVDNKGCIGGWISCVTSISDEQREQHRPLGHSATLRDASINDSVERGVERNSVSKLSTTPMQFPYAKAMGYISTVSCFVLVSCMLVRHIQIVLSEDVD